MIVDDHEIVRRGIAEIVDRADTLEVVAEAGIFVTPYFMAYSHKRRRYRISSVILL